MIFKTVDESIAILNFNLGKGNAFTLADMMELSEKLIDIQSDNQIFGLILTGSNKSFSIGGSLESIASLNSEEEISMYFETMDRLLIQLFSFTKPLIAAINGHAIGLGFLISLCADYIITSKSDRIKFGLPEIKIGMAIDSIMCEILNFNNLNGKALSEMIYKGELMSSNQAFNLGFIDEIVIESDLLEKSKSKIKSYLQSNINVFTVNKDILRYKYCNSMKLNFDEKKYNIYIELLKNKINIS